MKSLVLVLAVLAFGVMSHNLQAVAQEQEQIVFTNDIEFVNDEVVNIGANEMTLNNIIIIGD